jgi:phenylalanine-4-hydroxylase
MDDAVDTVELPADHPGFSDPAYRARRAAIAAAAASWQEGEEIPDVAYTSDEDTLWRTVLDELSRMHERYAVADYRAGVRRLDLPRTRVPQLREVDARVDLLTGFHIRPVPGLVPIREFYGSLARRCFLSTQYVRHHRVPFYTPEPDIIHEIIGHASMLACGDLADLYELAGRASLRAGSDEALDRFSRVFWFTLEFGVAWESNELRAYGAGLLSSYGEIQTFRDAEIRPFDVEAMAATGYDITQYQPVLFAAASYRDAVDDLADFFVSFEEG